MRNQIINSPLEKFTRMMFGRVIERLAVVMSEQRLSFSQVAALHIIDQEKNISIQDMSVRINLSLSAASRLIDDLVKSSFIIRCENQENRRSKILTLSQQGQDLLDQLSIERVKIVMSTTETLPKTISKKFLGPLNMNKRNKT